MKQLILSLSAIAAGSALASLALNSSDTPDSEQVNQLLADAKTQAYQLSVDAATMCTYTHSTNASWEVHSVAVGQMREHVNAAGRTLAKLEEVRKAASPWQTTAITRIGPLLKEIALNTETVINYLNKHPQRLLMSEYRDYLEANADVTEKLSGLVADFVSYGHTKNRLESLSSKLELPAKGTQPRKE
jgi:hypothetical protein